MVGKSEQLFACPVCVQTVLDKTMVCDVFSSYRCKHMCQSFTPSVASTCHPCPFAGISVMMTQQTRHVHLLSWIDDGRSGFGQLHLRVPRRRHPGHEGQAVARRLQQ